MTSFRTGLARILATGIAAASLSLAPAQSVQDRLNRVGDAAQLPSNTRLLELLNDRTLDELGLCPVNYSSSIDTHVPSFNRNNVDLRTTAASAEVIDALPAQTREYLEEASGFDLRNVRAFDVNYDASIPAPTDRLVLDLGIDARPHNTILETDGTRANRFASEIARIEVTGEHARAIAQALDDVCANTRFGELNAITGDQYLRALSAAAHEFEQLYDERSALRDEVSRLRIELGLATEPAPNARVPASEGYDTIDSVVGGLIPPVREQTLRPLEAPETLDATLETHEPLASKLELDIAYFELGVPVPIRSFEGDYEATLTRADDGYALEIARDGVVVSTIEHGSDVMLAYVVDPIERPENLENAHRASIYANPDGWRYDVLATTAADRLVAHREGPHDAAETYVLRSLAGTTALPYSFEASANGQPLNVANVTGEIGRSIELTTDR